MHRWFSRAEWLRLSGLYGFAALLHALGWGLYLHYAAHYPALIGLGFVAMKQARIHDAQMFSKESKSILNRRAEGHRLEASFRRLEERLAELDLKIRANLSAAR